MKRKSRLHASFVFTAIPRHALPASRWDRLYLRIGLAAAGLHDLAGHPVEIFVVAGFEFGDFGGPSAQRKLLNLAEPVVQISGFGDEFKIANILADGAVQLMAEDEPAKGRPPISANLTVALLLHLDFVLSQDD